MYTAGPDGKIALKPVSQVHDARKVEGQLTNPPSAQDGGRQLPLPPFAGEGGIFQRYLHPAVYKGGKGTIASDNETLQFHYQNVYDTIEHLGIGNVPSGFYKDWSDHQQLFINLGVGAVLCHDLRGEQKTFIDYYGDTLGLRSIDITPYHIKAEILQDLNEAFKMLQHKQGE